MVNNDSLDYTDIFNTFEKHIVIFILICLSYGFYDLESVVIVNDILCSDELVIHFANSQQA